MPIHKHLLIVLGILLVGLAVFFSWKAFAPTTDIIFPKGGETFVTGEVYELKWNGGPDSTHVFLIDTSTEAEDASISAVHRVYGIENKHEYDFTVPPRIAQGTYKLQIGNETSRPFTIVNPYGYRCTDGTEFSLAPSLVNNQLILTPATSVEPFPKTTLYKKGIFYENGALRIDPSEPDLLLSDRDRTTVCRAMGIDFFDANNKQ